MIKALGSFETSRVTNDPAPHSIGIESFVNDVASLTTTCRLMEVELSVKMPSLESC